MIEAASLAKAVFGGVLIGLAAAALLYSHGRLAGISGILGGAMHPQTQREAWGWRVAFLAGLLASGLAARVLKPELVTFDSGVNVVVLASAGVLAGFGARLSGGCTSGHGICGIGSFSGRSIAATVTFMFLGGVVVYVARHFVGGGA